MSDENCKVVTAPQKMQMGIEELNTKYCKLNEDIEQLKTCNTSQGSDLKKIQGEFEQTNKNIEEILQKLNELPDERFRKETKMDANNLTHSIKSCFTNSLKKVAIGTLSAFYAVADVTIEKTSNIKEGFQDIAAEAQYENKKRKCQPAENN